MTNILQFPHEKSLDKQLEEAVENLLELHSSLQRGYDLMQTLEDKLEIEEEKYNRILVKYVRAIGIENIPLGYLEHASEYLVVNVNTGEIRFEPPDEE
jgi:hypothetical protein